jgi:type VI protein secretion system component Hcp
MLALQRAVGNSAVLQLMRHPANAREEEQPMTVELPGIVDWIPIDSWGWGQSGKAGPTDGGKAQAGVNEITITRATDEDSSLLLDASARGTKCDQATLIMRRLAPDGTPGGPYLTLTMTDVYIATVSVGGADSDHPTESIRLNFGSVKVDQPQGP